MVTRVSAMKAKHYQTEWRQQLLHRKCFISLFNVIILIIFLKNSRLKIVHQLAYQAGNNCPRYVSRWHEFGQSVNLKRNTTLFGHFWVYSAKIKLKVKAKNPNFQLYLAMGQSYKMPITMSILTIYVEGRLSSKRINEKHTQKTNLFS